MKYGIRTNRLIIERKVYAQAVADHNADTETYKRLYPGWVHYTAIRLFGPNTYKFKA